VRPTHMQAQKAVAGIRYPVDRTELIEYAKDRGADRELLAAMLRLPEGRYTEPGDVGRAFAQVVGR
jgi:hypothetical protein